MKKHDSRTCVNAEHFDGEPHTAADCQQMSRDLGAERADQAKYAYAAGYPE